MTSAFTEVRFPTDIAFGSGGGPEYSTDIIINQGGYEQRASNWQQSRARYNVAHGVKTASQLAELIAFFRARRGRATGFRFKDWTDFSAANQPLGEGDGVKTSFQLVKTYQSGEETITRTITKPVEGTVMLYVNNVLQTTGISVNTVTGIVTFTAAPASGAAIAADFEFDVPVRFDTDRLSASLDNYGSHSWQDIPLIEVRI